jgi:hypothetical protein
MIFNFDNSVLPPNKLLLGGFLRWLEPVQVRLVKAINPWEMKAPTDCIQDS